MMITAQLRKPEIVSVMPGFESKPQKTNSNFAEAWCGQSLFGESL